MELHYLQSIRIARRKRIGRGGKRGTYSGRGLKGQKSRSGRRIRPALRDLILKLPKRRGFKNLPLNAKPRIFNLSDIVSKLRLLKEGKESVELDIRTLKQIGLLPPRFQSKVKILGQGGIDFPLVVKEIILSESAKAKIEKAGGTVVK